MNLDNVLIGISDLELSPYAREIVCQDTKTPAGKFCIRAACNGKPVSSPASASSERMGTIRYQFDDFCAVVGYRTHEGVYVDETIDLRFRSAPNVINELNIGTTFDAADFEGFTATPIPFKVGLDGVSQQIDLNEAAECSRYAEGWVLDNGEWGMLAMRVPTGDPLTCFVPLVVSEEDGRKLIQVGSVGPDGDTHFSRNAFLDTEFSDQTINLPRTRFVFFKGNWKTGYEVFRQMLELSIERRPDPRRAPCPITYNTFHDFGPSYDRAKLTEAMPGLASMGIGMLHLDPGWETVWGSNTWNDDQMGTPQDFIAEAKENGLRVGCWTSVHTTDPNVHNGHYIVNKKGEKYLAEDFTRFNPASVKLWGVCPASGWSDEALQHISRLGRAGLKFLNSDFHDWPWSGESCRSETHRHGRPLTRAQWALALNDFYASLHRQCPEMVIEMHDHVESGVYQTPVWYLYDRPDSYDEKWAYEFMWTTYQDLMDHKLFALYYLRLAEPIPLYLHINASSDNENALAFWYVASCVTHIGVGAVLRAGDEQRAAYQKAFAEYNTRAEAFTSGRFHGVDELTHVHVYPNRRRAVIVAFNLEDESVERELPLTLEDWGMENGALNIAGARATQEGRRAVISIGPRAVALVDLSMERRGN